MDLNSISKLWQHWTSTNWTSGEYNQRMRDGEYKGCFYSEGAAGNANPMAFKFLKEESTGALLQDNNNWEALAKVMATSFALLFPWQVPGLGVTVPGIVVPAAILGNCGLVQAGVSLYKNGVSDIRSQLPSFSRVVSNLMPILKASAVCLAFTLEYQMTSFTVYNWMRNGALLLGAGYVAYNPRGSALWVNTVEWLIGPSPKQEYHATANKNFDFESNWLDYIEGRIPLTYLFGIHSPGNIADEVGNDYVFVETEKKTN